MKLEVKRLNCEMHQILHQIELLCQQLPVLTVWELEIKLNYVKQRHFEFVNKAGRWLAYKLSKEREKDRENSRSCYGKNRQQPY